MDKKTLFWLSGLGSTAVYAGLLAFLFVSYMLKPTKIEISGQNIAIDILNSEKPEQQTMLSPPQEIKKILSEIKHEQPQKIDEQKEPSLDNAKNILKNFSHITEGKPTPKLPQQQPQQPTQQTQPTQNAKQLFSSLTLKKNAPSVTFSTSGTKSNEYLGRVAGIIKSGWNPYKSDIGLTAVIYMNIKSDGSFDFSIRRQSPNANFNERLLLYLNDIKSKGLPPPDDKKSISVEFNFIAKE